MAGRCRNDVLFDRANLHELEDGLVVAVVLEVEAVDVAAAEDAARLDQLADAFLDEARAGRRTRRRRRVVALADGVGVATTAAGVQQRTARRRQRRRQKFHLAARRVQQRLLQQPRVVVVLVARVVVQEPVQLLEPNHIVDHIIVPSKTQ